MPVRSDGIEVARPDIGEQGAGGHSVRGDSVRGDSVRGHSIGRQLSAVVSAVERLISGRSETVVIAAVLVGFLVLRTLFHTVVNIAVSIDSDTSEASQWASHFAFGYKHPPLTAWVFSLWFSVFPRADFAVYLLCSVVVTAALALAWRVARDHLDMNRALIGVLALTLVPLYTFLSPTLDANAVMMPFWAATVLFYLRARQRHGVADAALAGVFAALTFLGKYWAIFLLAGMVVASVTGAGAAKFWRSPAPWVMAACAAVVVAPHLHWYLTMRGGDTYAFVTQVVLTHDTFGTALARSAGYLAGSAAYVSVPLVCVAALWPGRAAIADIVWPRDPVRRQALVLLVVPLVLPAVVNLVFPQRLTSLWTMPNWPLLPIVLFGSPLVTGIDTRAAARVVIFALAVPLGAAAVSPVRAFVKMQAKAARIEDDRAYYRPVAAAAEDLGGPVRTLWGTGRIVEGLPFYLPDAHLLGPGLLQPGDFDDPRNRAEISANGVVIVCSLDDAACLASGAAIARAAGGTERTRDLTVTPGFLGFAGPPSRYRIIAVPAQVPGGGASTPPR